jgi:predicted enzyme related to lactoylglutathione lyase
MVTTVDSDPQTMRPKTPGAINGGMIRKDSTGPYPMIIIDVENADAHLAKVQALGGNIVMPKIPVGEYGYYARVSDPEGNIIGIWEERSK